MTPSVIRALTVAAALAVAATSAFGQTNTTPLPPFVYPATVSTSPVQVLPQNDRRRSLEFCNPNAVSSAITCSVCPVRSRSNSAAITCGTGAAGSVMLPAGWCWGKTASAQGSVLSTAWNAVCSSSTGFTAFETE